MSFLFAMAVLAARPDVATFEFKGGTPAELAVALNRKLGVPVAFGIEDGKPRRAASFEYASVEDAEKRFVGFYPGLVGSEEGFAVAARPFSRNAFPGLIALTMRSVVAVGGPAVGRGRFRRGAPELGEIPATSANAYAGLTPGALRIDGDTLTATPLASQYFPGSALEATGLRPDWILVHSGVVAAFEKMPVKEAHRLLADAVGGVIEGSTLKINPKTLTSRVTATWTAAATTATGLNRAKIEAAQRFFRAMRPADLLTFFGDPSSRRTVEAPPGSPYYQSLGAAILAQDAQRPERVRMAPRIDPRAPMSVEFGADGTVRITMQTLQGGPISF